MFHVEHMHTSDRRVDPFVSPGTLHPRNAVLVLNVDVEHSHPCNAALVFECSTLNICTPVMPRRSPNVPRGTMGTVLTHEKRPLLPPR